MRFGKVVLTGLLLVLLIAACGGGGEGTATTPPAEEEGGGVAAKTVDPATAGDIKGKVTFSGETDRGNRIRMNADPSCHAQHNEPVYPQEVKTGEGGALENVFVWVKSGLEDYGFEPPADPATLDQKGCIYIPHVFGVQTRQKIQIKNSDPTTHNINPAPANNRDWNKSQAPNQAPLEESFARQEVMIPIKCNVHPWMRSYIGVVAHPYFAVTGSDGTFELKGLPPGQYTVEAWHEKLGTKEAQVTLAASGSEEIAFSFGG